MFFSKTQKTHAVQAVQKSAARSRLAAAISPLEPRVLFAGNAAAYDYLSDLKPTFVANGYGAIGMDQSNGNAAESDGRTLKLNGARYRKGLGVHADSELHYQLDGAYRSFVADVGVDDEVGANGSVVFQVWADGEKLFDSGEMDGRSYTRRVNVDVAGRNELQLIVNTADGNADFDHADWAGARLVEQVGNVPDVTMPDALTINEPDTRFISTGTFSDLKPDGPWSASVDWGDGRGAKKLDIGDDGRTFALRHDYGFANPGTYNVKVRVTNGQAVGVGTCKVTVTNIAPVNVKLGNADESGRLYTTAGYSFTGYGVFEDPGMFSGEKYSFTADYGDGSTLETGDIPGHLFFLNHTYGTPGTYSVKMTVTDEAGNVGSGTNKVVVAAQHYTYLSDIDPTLSSGSVARDANAKNNGVLKINGQRYAKGLGFASGTDLTINLNGGYRALIADLGVDDSSGPDATATFQVFADGALVYDSGALTQTSASKRMNLDVTAAQTLRLVVNGSGATPDFADWGGIRVV